MNLSQSKLGSVAARHPVAALGILSAVATGLWVQRRARRAEREHPPLGRFIEVDGVRLHYVERGAGPAVVLLHGNTVLLQDFIASGLFDALSQRYRVVAFDRPGYGYSERPRDRLWSADAQARLLQQAMRVLQLDRPVVLGHSWGTLAALALARAHPTQVRGLVLVSGYYYPTVRLDVPLTLPTAIPVLGDVLRYTTSPLLARLLLSRMAQAMFAPRPVSEHFLTNSSREMMLRPSQLRADAEDAAFMIPAAAGLRRHYAELRLPVHILAGAGDKVVDPQAHAVRLHRELAHAHLEVLPDLGHMLHYQVPDKLVAAVDRVAQEAPR